ncbi:hypothetical protein P3X46_004096 [Hevea brasiliensis]|uniref:Prolamin-like domain-containing protein n=1 Tax=Hevea brasiliensis TaxID=3981 RepID=A0ABQ9MWF6_HEVBR|nr:hypothetical protein P3X46_004096 [Hevea brasiliensis]
MMKKQFAILLLHLFCSAAFFPQGLARPWLQGFEDEEPQGFALPPIPSKVAKCLGDFHVEKKCVGEIIASIWNHKVSVDPECCSSVDETSEDCAGTIFAGLSHSFFTIVLKNYCAHHK